MSFKQWAIKAHWFISSQLGVDLLLLLRSIKGAPAFVRDLLAFKKAFKGKVTLVPCLHDRHAEGGTTDSEYFWQDLLVARRIFAANPRRHIDIGSRVDGFVAHVAAFREVEVVDVRPITTPVPGVSFIQADLMEGVQVESGSSALCDSLSCLHALEHFGLGRYGDPINVDGHERGLSNMAMLLEPKGTFYLSTPIGVERVEFNANRVFDPRRLIALAQTCGLTLQKMTVIGRGGVVMEGSLSPAQLDHLAGSFYHLAIFEFRKARPQ